MSDLAATPPSWRQLVDEEEGLLVVDLDDAAADGAPWEGFGVQLALTVALDRPDPRGQPYDDEDAALADLEQALVDALGGDGRLVAVLTSGGRRELVAYVRSAAVVEPWRTAPPAGLSAYEVGVVVAPDPTWKGLREIAGLLADGEEPLVLPD